MNTASAQDMLRRIATLVSRHARETVFVLREDTPPAVDQPSGGRAGMYNDGPHAHACVELCFVVSGVCRIWTAHGFHSVDENTLVVIVPGTTHCEGWANEGTAYCLLWLVLIGDVCTLTVSRYAPSTGWNIGHQPSARVAGTDAVMRAVQSSHTPEADPDSENVLTLQGGLLLVLADMLRKAGDTGPATTGARHAEIVSQVAKYIDLHYAEPLTVAWLAALFRRSPNYLNSIFSQSRGMGIHAYLLQRRLDHAQGFLEKNGLSVKETAYQAGFTDPLYFSRLYRHRFGQPPSQARGGQIQKVAPKARAQIA